MKNNKYKLYIDPRKYKTKPEGKENGHIYNRISDHMQEMTPEEIANELAQGKTALFALLAPDTKPNNEHVISQSVVAIDFDNEKTLVDANGEFKKVRTEGDDYTTIEEALEHPFIKKHASFLYKTFSHTDEWNRFRAVFFLEEPLENYKQTHALYIRLMKQFNGIDENGNVKEGTLDISTTDSARRFYGGTQALEVDYSNTLQLSKEAREALEKEYLEHNKPYEASNHDTTELESAEAIELIQKYTNRNTKHLNDYAFYLNCHNVIRNAVQTGEIDQATAEASVMILANGNSQYEQANVRKLKSDRSTPRNKTPFKQWFSDGREQVQYSDIEATTPEERQSKSEMKALDNALKRARVDTDAITDFYNRIEKSKTEPPTPTGFKQVDALLDGGLRTGLQVIGAISSLGKTTLVMQLADQVAQYGKDVLIFSLEMAKSELMAKSVSRLTYNNAKKDVEPKTVNDILTGTRYVDYSKAEKNLIDDSIKEYAEYAENKITIVEGQNDTSALSVKALAERYKEQTGNSPIVIVDYLQILAPTNERGTEKMNADNSVKILKQLSRDLDTTVIAISSFNRANYDTPVSMTAFKESGGIEYGADIVLGLQFSAISDTSINDVDFDLEKMRHPRHIELKVLKNRNGETGTSIHFDFYAKYNNFVEREERFNDAEDRASIGEPANML